MDNARALIIKKTLMFWVPGVILLSFAATYTASKIFNDRQAVVEEGYQYENKDLGFSLFLPKQFEYFQTQRADADGLVKLEIFVPTSDREYPQEVPGYAKPLQVIVGDEEGINKLKEDDIEGGKIVVVGSGQGRIYALKFWSAIPKDWSAKWSEAMRDDILKLMKIES